SCAAGHAPRWGRHVAPSATTAAWSTFFPIRWRLLHFGSSRGRSDPDHDRCRGATRRPDRRGGAGPEAGRAVRVVARGARRGFRRRDLIVLGGDIGAGKSALALGLALRVAQQGLGVAFLSGEMDEERLMERALAIEGRATVDDLRAAKMSDQTRAGIGGAAVRLRDLPLTALPLAARDFETAAERPDSLRGPGAVVVDFLQLVPSPRGVARSTQDE